MSSGIDYEAQFKSVDELTSSLSSLVKKHCVHGLPESEVCRLIMLDCAFKIGKTISEDELSKYFLMMSDLAKKGTFLPKKGC